MASMLQTFDLCIFQLEQVTHQGTETHILASSAGATIKKQISDNAVLLTP
jgi:hypothetical protein